MISYDDINSWIKALGPYLGTIAILILIFIGIFSYAYQDELYKFFKTNLLKITLSIIIICIVIAIFWFIDNTDSISSSVKPAIKIVSIIVLFCILIGSIWVIDNNAKNLGEKPVRVVISPFQKISESSEPSKKNIQKPKV